MRAVETPTRAGEARTRAYKERAGVRARHPRAHACIFPSVNSSPESGPLYRGGMVRECPHATLYVEGIPALPLASGDANHARAPSAHLGIALVVPSRNRRTAKSEHPHATASLRNERSVRFRAALRSARSTDTVSYTHLTLPTSDLV